MTNGTIIETYAPHPGWGAGTVSERKMNTARGRLSEIIANAEAGYGAPFHNDSGLNPKNIAFMPSARKVLAIATLRKRLASIS